MECFEVLVVHVSSLSFLVSFSTMRHSVYAHIGLLSMFSAKRNEVRDDMKIEMTQVFVLFILHAFVMLLFFFFENIL